MATTLGDLTSNVSVKLGDATVGQYYAEALIKKSVGDAYRYYVMLMVTKGEGWFETTTDLTITANTETISLASLSPAYWKVSQLFKYVTDGEWPLKPREKRFHENVNLGVGSGDSYLPDYKQRGTNLVLMPTPQATEVNSLKLDYVYVPTFPTGASSDSFEFDDNFPEIYESNIEIRAAIKCMESKDAVGGVSDIATFRQELQALDEGFLATIGRDEMPDEVEYVGLDYSLV